VGPHSVQWDGTDGNGNRVASGFYIYRLVTDGRAMSRKMMLLK
jgi:flagellar hook assembly protein FlgD